MSCEYSQNLVSYWFGGTYLLAGKMMELLLEILYVTIEGHYFFGLILLVRRSGKAYEAKTQCEDIHLFV